MRPFPIDIEIRARKSEQAKGKEAEVEQVVPTVTEEIAEDDSGAPIN